MSERPGRWVVRHLQSRGGHVHLGTTVRSAEGGHVELADGVVVDAGLLVWAAGNGTNPVVARHTDLPVDERGLVVARADLRVGTEDRPVPDAWAAGDNASVPDLASHVPGAHTVPNAQHAVRQARLLAKNILADLRGRPPRRYVHHSLGTVATLGLGHGIFQYRRLVITGLPAWLIHRSYHVLAVPTWERKARVALGWTVSLALGRDIVALPTVQQPRAAFLAGGEPDLLLDDAAPDHVAPVTPEPVTTAAAARSV